MPHSNWNAHYTNPGIQPDQPFSPTQNLVEFIPDRLYLTWTRLNLDQYNQSLSEWHYLTIDNTLVYQAFFADFGPLNIANLYRFICFLEATLKKPDLLDKKIVLYSNVDHAKRANAAYLISTYMMVIHEQDPDTAYRPLIGVSPPLMPFRDAGSGPATYFLTNYDCLRGLYKAIQVGLFSFQSFDLQEYERYEKIENGDFNWISPKFIAFASPVDNPRSRCSADALADYFSKSGVICVVRLNDKLYDSETFVHRGIEHVEMFFPDGSCPTDDILDQFLNLAESRNGTIAVHCKAGLGRTGSLIGAYFMKHYKFTASEVIAFLRIIRPGSVVGPQQNWLHAKQAELHQKTCTKPLNPKPNANAPFGMEKPVKGSRVSVPSVASAIPNQPRKVHDPKDPYSVASSVNQYQKPSSNQVDSQSKILKTTKEWGIKVNTGYPLFD